MTPYLILTWSELDKSANMIAQRVRAVLGTLGGEWRLLIEEPGRLVAIGGDGRVATGKIQGMPIVVIGDVFARRSEDIGTERLVATVATFDDLCSRLVDACWGAYVAVQMRTGGELSLFRDPIGMLDGFNWFVSGVRVFASEAMPWLAFCAPYHCAMDWARVAELLLDSGTLAEATPLCGIDTTPTGAILDIRNGRRSVRRLWDASNFYDRTRGHAAEPGLLRDIVLHCTAAWAERYPSAVLEISGGFDSAVVAASAPGVVRGFNFFTDQLSGDERRYARAIGARSNIALTEVFMPVGGLSEADLEELPVGVRPGLSSASLFHDRPLAEMAAREGATALFTGHGGDSVFFQHPTAMIAADPSFPRRSFGAYSALAKWSKQSVWTVAGYAFEWPAARESRRTANDALAALPLADDVRRRGSDWVGEMSDFPPAKRIQLAAIAGDRGVIGPSWRSRAMTIVHPLLSQPLVEFAIATDIFSLTEGRRDRALAREAFAGMLPASVVERRGKGCLAQYFGRCLCASVPFLRTFLLDGLLVRAGILDRVRLEQMLDTDYLMRFDCYAKLRSAVVMEHWARVWEDRIDRMRTSPGRYGAESPIPCPAK